MYCDSASQADEGRTSRNLEGEGHLRERWEEEREVETSEVGEVRRQDE